jgi:beta-N-acetylhexosaminidase
VVCTPTGVDGDPAATVPLEQQVGALIVTGFSGTAAPAWLRERLAQGRLGGVVLFGRNVVSPAQVRALDGSIRQASHGAALVALDQEGGQVRRLPWASPLRDGSSQSTVHVAYRSAQAAAHDLRAVRANVNLAPVADVALGPSSEMRRRAFPGGPAQVAALVSAAVRGYRSTGVLATAKHFPGFGAARANTDDAVIRIDRTRAQLEQVELAPFRAAIAQRVPLIMVSHALYPALDPRNIASQSPAIIGGLLRGELRFRGLVVTDSLEARAVLARSSVGVAAERSLRAGADLLLLSGSVRDYSAVYGHLLAVARSDAGLRRRIADAYARVTAAKGPLRAAG